MKKILLSLSILLSSSIAFFGQTATDFTVTDCASTSHHLFAELDAGKVVVLVWVMPCSSCIGPAQTAFYAAQSFQSSYPGRVLYYLVDDLGGSCSTLNGWASTNSITPNSAFANTGNVIKMTDYGASGMPKVVVLGGAAHTVFDNEINSFNSSTLTTGITNALAAPNSINEKTNANFELTLFPNPATNIAKAAYTLEQTADVSFLVYNILGEKVKTIATEKQTIGKHETQINMESLSDGVYFIQLKVADKTEVLKFSITH